MKKHPSGFKLNEPLKSRNEQVNTEPVVLYDGRFKKIFCFINYPKNNLCLIVIENNVALIFFQIKAMIFFTLIIFQDLP